MNGLDQTSRANGTHSRSLSDLSATALTSNSGRPYAIEAHVTNESLEGVCRSLSPTCGDRVLAICGIGCVPFALAEYGCKVIAVDADQTQLTVAEQLRGKLLEGDYKAFLDVGLPIIDADVNRRSAYFATGCRPLKPIDDPQNQLLESKLRDLGASDAELYLNGPSDVDFGQCERLNTIRRNLKNVEFRCCNILDALRGEHYSIVYLSNVMGFNDAQHQATFLIPLVSYLRSSLSRGGLWYSTTGAIAEQAVSTELSLTAGLPKWCETDPNRSALARHHEKFPLNCNGWEPNVFRCV